MTYVYTCICVQQILHWCFHWRPGYSHLLMKGLVFDTEINLFTDYERVCIYLNVFSVCSWQLMNEIKCNIFHKFLVMAPYYCNTVCIVVVCNNQILSSATEKMYDDLIKKCLLETIVSNNWLVPERETWQPGKQSAPWEIMNGWLIREKSCVSSTDLARLVPLEIAADN